MGEALEAEGRPLIVAHRGLHTRYPENSRGAFRAAQSAALSWAECDVHASADGVPVVLHDELLDRTTMGMGPVSARTWGELKELHLRDPQGNSHWCKLPCLSELPERSMGLLVEIKPPDARDLVCAVIEIMRNCRRKWMLQSFDEANLIHALACDVNLPVAYLVEDRHSLERAIEAGWDRIHLFHETLDPATAVRLRENNISIGVWTVNAPPDIRRAVELGAKMIITDEPLLAKELMPARSSDATNRRNSDT